MNFISFQFLAFFAIVTSLYFALPYKVRWLLLLVSSSLFYMAFIPSYILILFTTILVDYLAAIFIEKSKKKRKKNYLIVSVLSTVLILFIFKYFNFFNSTFVDIANFFNLKYPIKSLNIILPIGLSFHTFQSLAYVFEVYKGRQKAEYNFGIYALYVMFYPQLLAGPIERPQNMIHQFREKHDFDYKRVTEGLKLMLWGAFQKVIIADRFAVIVNTIYKNSSEQSSLALLVATISFAFQIYGDFAGYSNIARGAARVMGFRLMKNFDYPYLSKSVPEFWRRWHISLSSWFKDYVYIPLGGSAKGAVKTYRNLMIVFLISGLWHGANWTFVVWGGIHGFLVIITNMTSKFFGNFTFKVKSFWFDFAKVSMTFFLVTIAWIFFRAENLSEAIFITKKILLNLPSIVYQIANLDLGLIIKWVAVDEKIWGISFMDLLIACVALFFEQLTYFFNKSKNLFLRLSQRPLYQRWAFYYMIILLVAYFSFITQTQFIYFQF